MTMLLALAVLVPYFNGGGYVRIEPDIPWFIQNSGTPSALFLNGIPQSQESGNCDMNMVKAFEIHRFGTKVGVLSDFHADRVIDCVRITSPSSEVYASPLPRWYADNVADAISDCISRGCKVVVVPGGIVNGTSTSLDTILLESPQTVIVWAAPDTSNASMDDSLEEYPYSANLPNIIYVNGFNRSGQHYQSALGTNCVAAPNRIIVAGYPHTYSDGCSYGAGLVGGIMALLRDKNPTWTASKCVAVVRLTSDYSGDIKRINPVRALQAK